MFKVNWVLTDYSQRIKGSKRTTYGTAQFKVDKARVWHVLNMRRFSFRTCAGMHALVRSMT